MNIAKFWEDISNRKVLELSKIYSEEEAKAFQAIKDLLNTKKDIQGRLRSGIT